MIHGGDFYGLEDEKKNQLMDFSANISPLGIPESVKTAMVLAMTQAVHYPDPKSRRLKGLLAKKHKVLQEQIICGNGAADIIYRLIFAVRPRKALVVHPTFVEYEEAMAVVDTELIDYPLNHKDFKIREDICDLITEDIDLIFICNPNNPTGVLTEKPLLEKILKKAEKCHALLILDECFLDFTGQEAQLSMVDRIPESKSLLILKSFTKMYAIPGIRLGYGLCSDEHFIQKMQKAGQTWSVNAIAEAAGAAAVSEEAYVAAVVNYVNRERTYMEKRLEHLHVGFIHGHANYILIHVPQVPHLYEAMLDKNIMIRTCGNYINLDDTWYRIAVNTHEQNKIMLDMLECVLEENK